MEQPHPPNHALHAYYTQLQAQVEAALATVEQVVLAARPTVERDLTQMRGLHAQARNLVRMLDQRVTAFERVLAAVDAALDPDADHPPVQGLRGHEIADTAVRVLHAGGHADEPIHYRHWFELVEQAGYRIAGKDPHASFIVALTRHQGIEQLGNRSGLYRLREDDES